MANEYSSRWFDAFLATIPGDWTDAEVDGVARFLPLPGFRRLLDVCCGPGRHAAPLADAGYEVTGVDRDVAAIEAARERVPSATFLALDQRDLGELEGTFDAAVILWQSFGYFDPATNDAVLTALAGRLRPGGRLLLDLYHPDFFADHAGTVTDVRTPDCRSITNEVAAGRLRSTITYVDGTTEAMDFELLEPDDLAHRAAACGFGLVAACTWWDPERAPSPAEPRYQLVLEQTGP